ncbi:hypothetical protein LJB42_002382 [Komagataella kurtzmanii]|nr:hypothetical protein LJB42_002382 [Komagataella kurtzmanii]
MPYIDLVRSVDSVPHKDEPSFHEFEVSVYKFLSHDGILLGYIIPKVAKQFEFETQAVIVDNEKHEVKIIPSLDTENKRTQMFAKIAQRWRDQRLFETLSGWRNELFAVYCDNHKMYMLVERAFSNILGVVTYGVHINGYLQNSADPSSIQLWIPKRSRHKPTFPGMLDNTVAGGLEYPNGTLQTCLKECYEEAGLNEDYVSQYISPVGAISYMFRNKPPEDFIQPEVEYIYDLPMEQGLIPNPIDHESEDFRLMNITEVVSSLLQEKFKPNCALAIIDFLIRFGIISSSNCDSYLEIVTRLHRNLEFPLR